MKVWSETYSTYVSETYAEDTEKERIKINLSDCTIRVTEFGFYDLLYEGKKIRRLDVREYIKYRYCVKSVEIRGGYDVVY